MRSAVAREEVEPHKLEIQEEELVMAVALARVRVELVAVCSQRQIIGQ